jgi:ABC-type microcin C transport system duplicated ATPase subunit YejF
VQRLLANRGVTTDAEIRVFLDGLPEGQSDPFSLPDMECAVERVRAALDGDELVAVFGDFDVDGVTAAALLTEGLASLGGRAVPYLPDRFREGYGLNVGAVEELRRRERAKELLALVGLADRMKHLPSQLSGGERQRVAVARSLANRPRLVLADEPTGNLDTAAGEEIMHLLADLNLSQRTTIVVVTHDRRVARATDRILTMRDGRITDDHAVADPLTEDLRDLGRSRLGQRLLTGQVDELGPLRQALTHDGRLTPGAERLVDALRELV